MFITRHGSATRDRQELHQDRQVDRWEEGGRADRLSREAGRELFNNSQAGQGAAGGPGGTSEFIDHVI